MEDTKGMDISSTNDSEPADYMRDIRELETRLQLAIAMPTHQIKSVFVSLRKLLESALRRKQGGWDDGILIENLFESRLPGLLVQALSPHHARAWSCDVSFCYKYRHAFLTPVSDLPLHAF